MPLVRIPPICYPDVLELTAEHTRLAEETAEVAALHKSITDMELELARLKSTYPPEKVAICTTISLTAAPDDG